MKILVTLIVALAAVLCLLLFIERRMGPLVAESPIEAHWLLCDPGQFVTAEGKCETRSARPDIEVTVPLTATDHPPIADSILVGEPSNGMLGTGVINVMPSQKVYRNGHELMDEEQWRARLNCAASP